ncbi:MAG: hypothetical protein KC635_20820 [Myxococcales bacterium]|nr:hypothetical protein [Myxococcales bacterium]
MPRLLAALAGVLLLSVSACGGDDSSRTDRDTAADTSADTAVPQDTVDDTADTAVATDTGDDDTAADTADADTTPDDTDTSAPLAPAGSPCSAPADCASGACLGGDAKVCVDLCDGAADCSEDRPACLPTSDAAVSVCASRDDVAGLPCAGDDACAAGATCVALDDGVSRCVFACSGGGGCDGDATCDDGVCVPPGGFGCTLLAAATGATSPCANANEHGTCQGAFRCTAEGAGSCDAATPAVEVCDGADDDCDGTVDDVDCDDADPCTVDACDPDALGQCKHTPAAGAACEDGDTCTQGDICTADGTCVAGSPCACDTAADCVPTGVLHPGCVVATCEGTPGRCVLTPTNAGGACGTPDACRVGGTCDDGGVCAGLTDTCDDGNDCTTDVCAGGACTNRPAPVGLGCSDHDACTTGDTCVAGGLCIPSDSIPCDDGNPCTDDACDPATGCVHTNNAAACDDGDLCTTGDVCQAGACHGEDLGCGALTTACATGTCTARGCVAVPTAGACDDGDPCTLDDTCADGRCHGTALDCSDLDTTCGEGTCVAGACVAPTRTCDLLLRTQQVSAAVERAPAAGSHGLDLSVGHTGPVGRAANATGLLAIFGFHTLRLE